MSTSQYEIYVDGSFINGATGYGAVILKQGSVVDELFGAVAAAEVSNTRQVAGELIAVKESLKWCREHSIDEVSIYYDYLGIEKWAMGQWKTNQPLTKEYARYVRECPIKIHWRKVASHTGDRWNDRADALAKKGALSIPEAITETGLERSLPHPGGETGLIGELTKVSDDWIEYLMVNGIDARFDRIFNEQFARVYILSGDNAVGTFDLYNTRKKRLSPYLHNFRDEELKLGIETLWNEFRLTK